MCLLSMNMIFTNIIIFNGAWIIIQHIKTLLLIQCRIWFVLRVRTTLNNYIEIKRFVFV
jgi:hypothetical protein